MMDVFGAIALLSFISVAALIALWIRAIVRRDMAIQRLNAESHRPPEPWRPTAPPIEVPELELLIAATPALVIHCWAIWNGADRSMVRSWSDVGPNWAGRIVLRSFDVDPADHQDMLQKWNVHNVPATVLFRNGSRFGTRCYFMKPAELDAWLTEVFGESAPLNPEANPASDNVSS
jgi:hypothetical protein